jgi:hypothetical protein
MVFSNLLIWTYIQINEVRELLGDLPTEMPGFLTDSTIRRFLRTRNWSTVQATKALKETVKWRRQYRPDKIRWVSSRILLDILI